MRQLGLFVAILGMVAALYVGLHNRARRAPTQSMASARSEAAPTVVAEDIAGNRVDTSSYKGKVLLINFWAAWCTPCAEEVPRLVSLQEKYAGLQVIGISMDDKPEVLREFYRKNKMNYPVVAGNQRVAQQYGGILGLPTTFLVGRDGRIRAKHAGLADFGELEREVVELLK